MALDERVVDLLDRAFLERPLEQGVGPLGLGDDHQAAGADVEPVHDALALRRAAGRDAEAGAGEPADHGRPGPAGARVRGDADRLVDHDEVVVVVHDVMPGHRLGDDLRRGRRRGQVTSSQAPACTRSDLIAGAAVDQHVAGSRPARRPGCGRSRRGGPGRRRAARPPGRRARAGFGGRLSHPCSIADAGVPPTVSRRPGRARRPKPSSRGSGCRRRTTSSPRSRGPAGRCPPRRGRSGR